MHISFHIDETNKSYYIWRLKIIDPKNRCREDETGPMWSKFLVPKLDPASGRRFRLAPYLGVETFASSNISKSTACEVIPCEGIWTCDHFTISLSFAPICIYGSNVRLVHFSSVFRQRSLKSWSLNHFKFLMTDASTSPKFQVTLAKGSDMLVNLGSEILQSEILICEGVAVRARWHSIIFVT